MRSFFLSVVVLFTLAFSASVGNAGVYIKSPNGKKIPTTWAKAITSADASGGTVVINSPINITAETEWPTDRELEIDYGGRLKVAAGYRINLQRKIPIAGDYQIFEGPGLVWNCKEVRARWFGAVGDATANDLAALQRAVDAVSIWEGTLFLGGGAYKISGGPLRIHSGITIKGVGRTFGCRIDLYDSAYISIDGTRSRVLGTDGNMYSPSYDLQSFVRPTNAGYLAEGWIPAVFGSYTTGVSEHIGYTATGTDGKKYRCKKEHVSTAATKPITGADWATYWEEIVPETWATGNYYQVASDDYVFRIHLQDFMVYPQTGNTATAAISINGTYNVQLHRIQVHQFQGQYGIYISRTNAVELQYCVVYGKSYNTAGSVGIYIGADSPSTTLIKPDVEACETGISVNGQDTSVDIYSPYIERTYHGVTGNTVSSSTLNIYGGTIGGENEGVQINGPNVHVINMVSIAGYGVATTSALQLYNSYVDGIAGQASALIYDPHGALTLRGVRSNTIAPLYNDNYHKRVTSTVTVNNADASANLLELNFESPITYDGQVISGTITFYATIGNGVCVRKRKYSFAIAKTSTDVTESSMTLIEDSGVDTAEYTLTFTGSITHVTNRSVFRALATAGGTTGASTINVNMVMEVDSNSPGFSVVRY